MRSASLLVVFILAKLVIVWGHAATVTGWSLVAYTWQDVMVALAFYAFDMAMQKIGGSTRIVWLAYWAIAIYTAINIPVGRVVFTPLTRPMLRAARGPLADSMAIYLTAANVLLVVWILAAAAGLPLLCVACRGSLLVWPWFVPCGGTCGTDGEQPCRYARDGPQRGNGADRRLGCRA